jgi:hypothetical protein
MLSVELIRGALQMHKVWVHNHNLNPNKIGDFRKLLPAERMTTTSSGFINRYPVILIFQYCLSVMAYRCWPIGYGLALL